MSAPEATGPQTRLGNGFGNIYRRIVRFYRSSNGDLNNNQNATPNPNVNPNPNNGNEHTLIIQLHQQLFQVLFYRISVKYANWVPSSLRKLIEFQVLLAAVLSFVLLTYAHWTFSKPNKVCVHELAPNWRNDGIIRLVIPKMGAQKEHLNRDLANLVPVSDSDYEFKNVTMLLPNNEFLLDDDYSKSNANILDFNNTPLTSEKDYEYAIEFAFEYGFLRLSDEVRKKYRIPVTILVLDRKTHPCFGSRTSRFILDNVLGYDSVLISNLKGLSNHVSDENGDHNGYLRNIQTNEHFILVNVSSAAYSYLFALIGMIVFTLTTSIILRYSHHEIFLLTEFNAPFVLPFSQILTIIIALFGMETLTSLFFNDNTIAFYAILIVWFADKYDSICCNTLISKRHWLKFFFLYQYIFYAYQFHYGHYSKLALVTFWLFILLPKIMFNARIHNIMRERIADSPPNRNTILYTYQVQDPTSRHHRITVISTRLSFLMLYFMRTLYRTGVARLVRVLFRRRRSPPVVQHHD